MDNWLFYTLLIALALYFFYYLPSQKKTSSHPGSQPSTSQSTQTDPELTEKTPGSFPFSNQERTELEQTLDFLIKEMRELDKSLDVPF